MIELLEFIKKLDKESRWYLIKLILFGLIVASYEAYAISLIPRLVSLLKDPDNIKDDIGFYNFETFSDNGEITFLLFIGTIFVSKSVIYTYYARVQTTVLEKVQEKFTKAHVIGFFSKGIVEHKDIHSSDYVKKLTTDNYDVATKVLIPGTYLIIESITMCLLMVLLYVNSATATIFCLLFGAILFFLYKDTLSARIKDISCARALSDSKRITFVKEMFNGAKEIVVYNKKNKFLKKFEELNNLGCNAFATLHFYHQVPRIWLDTIALILIVVLVIASKIGGQVTDLLPFMALLAVVGVRLMPCANRIISSINDLKFSANSINSLPLLNCENVRNPKVNVADKDFIFERIELQDVGFSYGKRKIISNFNLTISRGETVAIVGPSGAGKSTIVEILIGLMKPTVGRFLVNGKSDDSTATSFLDNIAYVPQEVSIFYGSLLDNIIFSEPGNSFDLARVKNIIEKLSLQRLVSEMPHGLNSNLGESGKKLSGGERQRIGLARALYSGREVLILDEATSALDKESQESIISYMESLKGKLTIIFITHRLGLLKIADKVIKL